MVKEAGGTMTMEIEPFGHRIQAMHQRVRGLYRRVGQGSPHTNLLPQAFEELQTALEELEQANLVLRQQQQELENTRALAEVERQSYQELFEQAPEPYLVSSPEGGIRKTNHAACLLLNSPDKFLHGRPLVFFIPEGGRRAFGARLARLREQREVQRWEERLQPLDRAPFDVLLTVAVARDRSGRPTALRWQIRDSSPAHREAALLRRRVADLERELARLRAEPPLNNLGRE